MDPTNVSTIGLTSMLDQKEQTWDPVIVRRLDPIVFLRLSMEQLNVKPSLQEPCVLKSQGMKVLTKDVLIVEVPTNTT
jgi:hypothetical protein